MPCYYWDSDTEPPTPEYIDLTLTSDEEDSEDDEEECQCPGCLEEAGNQLAHYGPNGCIQEAEEILMGLKTPFKRRRILLDSEDESEEEEEICLCRN